MSGNGEYVVAAAAKLAVPAMRTIAMAHAHHPDFRLVALAAGPFLPLHALSDDALLAQGARRLLVDTPHAYPCRVSLADGLVGEHVILLPWVHHDVAGPYRASGPIYVREHATGAQPAPGEIPDALRRRLLSLRAYDSSGWMHAADVCDGNVLAASIARLFDDARIAYLHLHNAKPGCYACRVERA